MKKYLKNFFGFTIIIFFCVFFTLGATYVLAHNGDFSLIHACVKNSNGSIRIVGANDTCNASTEAPLDWNIQGIQGAPGSGGDSGTLPPRLMYAVNGQSNTLSIIDPNQNPTTTNIRVGKQPRMVLQNPNGTRLFVVNFNESTNGSVSVIDTSNNTVVATLSVGKQPRSAMLNNSGTRLYVANFTDNTLSVIDTTNNTVLSTISAGQLPSLLAINSSDTYLYINNVENNTITVIDTTSNAVATTIPVVSDVYSSFNSSTAKHMVFNSAGTRGYIVNGDKSKIFLIDTSSNTLVQEIIVGQNASAIEINPAGSRVYVANEGSVSVIDTATNTIIQTIAFQGSDLNYMVGNTVGTRLYIVQSRTDRLSVVDTTNNTIAATISIGNSPKAITIDPNNNDVYIANSVSDDVSIIDTMTLQETVIKIGKAPQDILVP